MVFFSFLRVQRYIFFPYKACFEENFIWRMIFCFLMIDILCHKFQVSSFKSQITSHKSQKNIIFAPMKLFIQTQ